jgi:hypothetical protein
MINNHKPLRWSLPVLLMFLFTLVPFPLATAQAACTDRATFISDVTVPDNTRMEAVKSFEKVWRLKNSGTCTWTTSYALVFSSGDRMEGAKSVALGKSVRPNETADLKVTLKAPSAPGTYTGYWKLRNAQAKTFGLGINGDLSFWVKIVVGKSNAPATWRGEYYANRTLSGQPSLIRQEAKLDFDWGRKSPSSRIPADNFSARWTTNIQFEGDLYLFKVVADDGVRLYVDDKLVIDSWKDSAGAERTAQVRLSKGLHGLRLEYYERAGLAKVRLSWGKVTFSDWKGEYFSNMSVKGEPTLVRNDKSIRFNWGRSAPAEGLPKDYFSARWTRTLNFEGGRYQFRVRADDGVRVYLDGKRILNKWFDSDGMILYTTHERLTAGKHTLVVEYFEKYDRARIQVEWSLLTPPATPTPTTPPATSTPTPEPTATPEPSNVYAFTEELCRAEWRSGAGLLTCPGTEGDVNGFMLIPVDPVLEDGVTESGPAILVQPQQIEDGLIRGTYPAFTVQAGDQFRTRTACLSGYPACDVMFQLNYRIGGGPLQNLATWTETGDGKLSDKQISLSPLAGHVVQFVLTASANGSPSEDLALWVDPRILR